MVRVARPDFTANLAPGHEVLLSTTHPSKNDMVPADGVGRRKAEITALTTASSCRRLVRL